jgi:tryptophan synthase alpha chain
VLPRIRAHESISVGVDFGIGAAATARAISRSAQAVVIGSWLIPPIEAASRRQTPAMAQEFLQGMRLVLDGKTSKA